MIPTFLNANLAPLDGVLLLLAARLGRLLDRVEHGTELRQPVAVHGGDALRFKNDSSSYVERYRVIHLFQVFCQQNMIEPDTLVNLVEEHQIWDTFSI